MEETLKNYIKAFTNSTYKVVLYGDGRVVCLEKIN